MFIEIKLAQILKDYIYPNTHEAHGRSVAKCTGAIVCLLFWFATVMEFGYVITELKHYGSAVEVFGRFGHSFFLVFASMFWLISALSIYTAPVLFGTLSIVYILAGYVGLLGFGTDKPYLSITNVLLCFIAMFVFLQVVLAGRRDSTRWGADNHGISKNA